MKQLARLARHTGIGPDELLAHPDVCQELLELAAIEQRQDAERARKEAFDLRTQLAFGEAAARARR